jgi:hypothetical protein
MGRGGRTAIGRIVTRHHHSMAHCCSFVTQSGNSSKPAAFFVS